MLPSRIVPLMLSTCVNLVNIRSSKKETLSNTRVARSLAEVVVIGGSESNCYQIFICLFWLIQIHLAKIWENNLEVQPYKKIFSLFFSSSLRTVVIWRVKESKLHQKWFVQSIQTFSLKVIFWKCRFVWPPHKLRRLLKRNLKKSGTMQNHSKAFLLWQNFRQSETFFLEVIFFCSDRL